MEIREDGDNFFNRLIHFFSLQKTLEFGNYLRLANDLYITKTKSAKVPNY